MEKKNMVLLTVIAVATLLVAVVGATFAYFTATITDSRGDDPNKGQAAIQAAQTPGSLIIEESKEGFGSFNEKDVYPGHKELIQFKVTSSADNTTDTYFNIVYDGSNEFPDDRITFDIYESHEDIGITAQDAFKCEKKSIPEEGSTTYKLYEECKIDDQLSGEKVNKLISTPLKKTSGETIINGAHPFVITGNEDKTTIYYYVVATYKNDEGSDQGASEQGQSLNGKLSIKIAASDTNAIKDDDNNMSAKSNE